MLGREPRSISELLMVYGGILAHGTACRPPRRPACDSAADRPAVRRPCAGRAIERRLAEACGAVLTFMHRHPIAATWGRSDLASSDMMSLETAKRYRQARSIRAANTLDRLYSHVRRSLGHLQRPTARSH